MLTEREAWLKLAEWCEHRYECLDLCDPHARFGPDRLGNFSGLCRAIDAMHDCGSIDASMRNDMRSDLREAVLDAYDLYADCVPAYVAAGYAWPRTSEGIEQRRHFCLRQAEKAEQLANQS